MLQKIKEFSLRKQIIMVIMLEIALTVLIQALFYINLYKLTYNSATTNASNVSSQVENIFAENINNIKSTAKQISYSNYVQKFLVSEDPSERLLLYNTVSSTLSLSKMNNQNIYEIYLIDKMNREVRIPYDAEYSIESSLVNKQAILSDGFRKDLFSSEIYRSSLEHSYYSYSMPIFSALPGISPLDVLGVCVIICKTEQLQSLVGDMSLPQGSIFFVRDKYGNIVVISNKDKFDEIASIGPDAFSSDLQTIVLGNEKYLTQIDTLPETGWKTTCLISINELHRQTQGMLQVWVIMCGIVVLLLVVMGALLIYGITSPISRIARFTTEMGRESSEKRLVLTGNNEIGRLSEYINVMLDKIDHANKTIMDTQNKVYEIELNRKQAELSALKSQINPHFLYNTLDCIHSIALANNVSEIAEISEALSRIFRYSIKGDELSPVRDELECIKSYISIINTRYPNRFLFNIEVDERVMDIKIPKMILQPLVENAIYHGMEPKRGKCSLLVKGGLMNDGMLFFEIADDGVGMQPEELDTLILSLNNSPLHIEEQSGKSKRSIGLRNIYSRIRLLFGDESSIDIRSKKAEGTCVRIELNIKQSG